VCFVLQYTGPICKKDISKLLTLLEWYLLIPSTEMNTLSLHLKEIVVQPAHVFCFGNFES
jgi:hypothetical protein